MGEMADLDADAMGDLPDDESTTLEEDGVMEPLRERVKGFVREYGVGQTEDSEQVVAAILQAVEEDRAALERDLHNERKEKFEMMQSTIEAEAREAMQKVELFSAQRALLTEGQARNKAETNEAALVAAIFDALTCVDCHNCAKHYEQMRSARDAALGVEHGK